MGECDSLCTMSIALLLVNVVRDDLSESAIQQVEEWPVKDTSRSKLLVPMNVTLYGNSFFADILRLRILIQDCPGFIVGPKSNGEYPYKCRTGEDTLRRTVLKTGRTAVMHL